jgi:hypothetical protein
LHGFSGEECLLICEDGTESKRICKFIQWGAKRNKAKAEFFYLKGGAFALEKLKKGIEAGHLVRTKLSQKK